MDLLRQIAQQFARIYRGMTVSQRMSITMLTFTVVVSIVLLVVWSRTTQYAPLFTGVSAAQANEAIAQLEQMGEEYRYRGGTIEVRPERRDIIFARLTEAEALPQVKDPFAWIFVDTPLAETKGRLDLKTLVALERKLQIMIGHLNSVRSATVAIARQEETPFVRKEEEEAKAAVTVQLASGVGALPANTVRAITHLVAGAVKGLKPERVAIVDQNGRAYRMPSEAEGALLAANQFELKRQVEKGYEDKILALFAPLQRAGRPGPIVAVNVELDFTRVEKEIKDLDPDKVVTTHERTRESSEDTSGGEGAPPGVGVNVELEPTATGAGERSTKTEEEREVTKEPSWVIQKIFQSPGTMIKDRSVAVLIPVEEGEAGLGEEDLATYRRLAMQGAGIADASKIEVSTLTFPAMEEVVPTPVPMTARIFSILSERGAEWGKYAGVLILILVALMMLRSILKKAVVGAPAARPAAAAAGVPGLPSEVEVTDVDRMRTQLVEMVDESPDVAADLIKRWLMTE